ncbi:MAG: carboxypeptidase-like regulatory domain-containing protein [Propionibacteriaceae bacterium]|jgi:hypothetical protein|nr:carboxypeptidase-like regulatory domain-containing protein [Propionibacteriaceae bacterium]
MRSLVRPLAIIAAASMAAMALVATPTAEAAQHVPITGKITDSRGNPLVDLNYEYDNVECELQDGKVVDKFPDDFGVGITGGEWVDDHWTDDAGEFTINGVKGDCYQFILFDAYGWETPLVYNGEIAGFALLQPGATDVVITTMPEPSKPVKVHFEGATAGSFAQLVWLDTYGEWEEIAESRIGGQLDSVKAMWPDATDWDTSAVFYVIPGQTYTFSYSGDAGAYAQNMDGSNYYLYWPGPDVPVYSGTGDSPDTASFTLRPAAAIDGKVILGDADAADTKVTLYHAADLNKDPYTAAEEARLLKSESKPARVSSRAASTRDEDPYWYVYQAFTVPVADDGSYSLTGLIPGEKYVLSVDNPTYLPHWLGGAVGGADEVWLEDLEMATAPATVSDIKLTQRAGVISGSVRGWLARGALPLGSQWSATAINLSTYSQYASEITSAGKYRIPQVPAGVYLVQAYTFWTDGYFDYRLYGGFEQVVTVQNGQSTPLDIVFENREGWDEYAIGDVAVNVEGREVIYQDDSWTEYDDPEVGDVYTAVGETSEGTVSPSFGYTWYSDRDIYSDQDTLTVGRNMIQKPLGVLAKASGEQAWPGFATANLGEVRADQYLEAESEPEITSGDNARVGVPIVVDPGTWDPEPDSIAYEWYADDELIAGADRPIYTPKESDLGKEIYVVVTISKEGYATERYPLWAGTVEIDLNVVISGTAKVGKTLTSTVNASAYELEYQWLRNGEPFDGADGPELKLTKYWAGRYISLQVTALANDEIIAQQTSDEIYMAKLKSKMSVKTTRTPTASRSGKLKVTIKVPGDKVPSGKIKVSVKGYSKTYKLSVSDKGVQKVTLPKLGRGTYTITIKYYDNSHNTTVTKKIKKTVR